MYLFNCLSYYVSFIKRIATITKWWLKNVRSSREKKSILNWILFPDATEPWSSNIKSVKRKYVSVCVTLTFVLLLHFSISVVSLFSAYSWCVPSVLVCNLEMFSLNRFVTFEQRCTTVAFFYVSMFAIHIALYISYRNTQLRTWETKCCRWN